MLPNFMDFSLTFCPSCNGNDCDGADEDKNDGDGNDADSSINGEGGDNEYIDTKHSDRDDGDYKMILVFKMVMMLKANFCNSILSAFPQFLMRIYHFLVQLHAHNLCIITLCRVIGLYKPSYDIALSSTCWFHLYRIFKGNYLPSRFYVFA